MQRLPPVKFPKCCSVLKQFLTLTAFGFLQGVLSDPEIVESTGKRQNVDFMPHFYCDLPREEAV